MSNENPEEMAHEAGLTRFTSGASLRQIFSASLLLQGAGLGLLTVAQILIAHHLGVSGFGVYSYATAWAATLVTVAKFGTDTVVYRFGGQYLQVGDWAKFKGLVGYSQRLVLKASFAACLLMATLALLSLVRREMATMSVAMLIACISIPVMALSTLRQASLVTMGDVVLGLAPEQLVRPMVLIVLVLAMVAAGVLDARVMIIGYVAAYVAAFGLGQRWLAGALRDRSRHSPDIAESPKWLESARGVLAFMLAYQLIAQYDILAVGYLLDVASTGVYAAARQIASVGLLGIVAFQLVSAPRIAAAHAASDNLEFRRLVRSVGLGGLAFTGAYGLFIVLAGDFLLGLLGEEFRSGRSVLYWLLAVQLINSLCGPAGTVTAMLGLHRDATMVFLISTLIGVGAMFTLVPEFGLNGAGMSMLLTTTFWSIGLNLLLRYKAGSPVWLLPWQFK